MAAPKLSCATETTCPASADRQHNPYLRCAFGASPDRTNHSSPRTYNYIGTNEKSKVRPRSKRQRRAKSKATSNGSVHVARLPPKKDVVANAHTSLAYMIKKRVEIRKKRKSEWKRRTDEARTTSIASIASTTKQTAPRGTTTVAKIGIPTRGAAVPTAPALHRNTHFL